jgi:leucyl-tRNA synthetase
MELVGTMTTAPDDADGTVLREAVDATLRLLAPFVPHVSSELWERTGHDEPIEAAGWPVADPGALVVDTIEIPVQVNGRVRGRVELPVNAEEAAVLAAALADERVRQHVGDGGPRKHIYVPGRMLNLIV